MKNTSIERKDEGSRYYENVFHQKILATNPFRSDETCHFEIHVLTSSHYVSMTLWSLKSFCTAIGRVPQIVVHDDGTVDQKQFTLLRLHFPNAKIISDSYTRSHSEFRKRTAAFPLVDYWRWQVDHPLARRLIDFVYFASRKFIVVFDSDVLFFKNSMQLQSCIAECTPFYSEDYIESYSPARAKLKDLFHTEPVSKLNGGLWGIPTNLLDLEFLEAFLRGASEDQNEPLFNFLNWSIDQTILAMILSKCPEREMLDQKRHSISFLRVTEHTCSHHFPSDQSRLLFYRVGLRKLDEMGFLDSIGYFEEPENPKATTQLTVIY